ncbi:MULTISPECIES: AraC family transcriptional regulator [Stenotrophomonas]|jgi:AraC family transcriptional regulator|uniref:AraC family transcriptional regulator n=1 Tax=Stenotrophomonas TaxID=40323 RepID=UPI0024DE4ACB|nr:AraC family transcriptional regulator [Stenotrophomonas sp. BIO128-Bstrain]WIA61918.1 AraC family transcriptional regulator [Stenotrophomonas sp. BIO128-Bstrain]
MRRIAQVRQRHGIDRVIAHLQACLRAGDPLPDLEALAAIAHQSPFHFHRLYRALTGETPGRTVARLRLLQALQLLGKADSRVTEVALNVGYESPQALARACRQALDATPSSLRENAGLRSHWQQRLALPAGDHAGGTVPLQVTVTTLEPFDVVALRTQGAFDDLDQAFGEIFTWAAEQGWVEQLQQLIGIARTDHRDAPAQECVFDCAMGFGRTPQALPTPLRALTLGGGTYAVLRHVGSYAGLEAATDALLRDWLPDSGHTLRDAELYYHYLDDPEQVPDAILRADICVPVG